MAPSVAHRSGLTPRHSTPRRKRFHREGRRAYLRSSVTFEYLEDRRVLANFDGIGNFLQQRLTSLQTTSLVANNALGTSLPVAGTTLQALAQGGTLLTAATNAAGGVNDNTTDPAVMETNLEAVFGAGTVTNNNDDSFRIQFSNSSTVNIVSFTSGLNILPIDGAAFSATLQYTMDITVGIDGSGFYFKANNAQPELLVSLTIADSALPALEVKLGDLIAAATPQADATPALDLDFTIDVTGALLRAGDTINITTDTAGAVDVDLGLTLDFPIGSLTPQLTANFDLNWDLSDPVNNPSVVFADVGLDLGSLVNGFGGESLRTMLEKAEPAFALAHKFTEPLPGLSDLSEQLESLVGDLSNVNTGVVPIDTILHALAEPTLLNFMEASAPLLTDPDEKAALEAAVTAIKAINEIGELVNGFLNQSSLIINFGTFTLGASTDLEAASGDLGSLTPTTTAPGTPIGSQSGVSGLQAFLNDNHLTTDLLDPAGIFQLLAGSDSVKIIEYARTFTPTDSFDFVLVNQNFAIGVVPANFQVAVVVDPVSFNVRFGFDSRGLTSGDIAQGLYVGAKGAGDSADFNLINVGAHLNVDLAVGQDYDIASARLGVRGSIDAAAGVYFVEQPANSGKLHVSDFGAGCTPLAGELNVEANVSLFYDVRLNLDLEAILNSVKTLVEQAIKNNPALLAVDKMIDAAAPLLEAAGIDPQVIADLQAYADNPETALKAVVEGLEAIGSSASEEFEEFADKLASGGASVSEYLKDRIPDSPEDLGNAIITCGGLCLAGGGGIGASDSTVLFSSPILTWQIGDCGSRDYGGGTATPFASTAVPAILGEVVDGVLTIFVGAKAHLRSIEQDEIDEPVTIRPADPGNPGNGEVVVSMFGASQTFTGVTSIEANAGDGINVIDGAGTALPMSFIGGNEKDTFIGGLKAVVFFGGDGPNELIGSPENDILYGGAGVDSLLGLGGNDTLHGYGGNDYLIGDYERGSIEDTPDDPALFGADTIYAGAGHDYVYAGPGNDEVDGGLGNDTLRGGAGIDTIYGGGGHENIGGGDDNDVIFTGQGNSYIDAGKGNDVVNAGHGTNFIIGGPGDDTLIGNIVTDVFYYSEGDGSDVYEGNGGENYLLLDLYSGGTYSFSQNGTRLDVAGQGTIDGQPANFVSSGANLNQVYAHIGAGGSSVTVGDLSDTNVDYLNISLGLTRTGNTDLFVRGSEDDDDLFVAAGDGFIEVLGLPTHIVLTDTAATDELTVYGRAGDDRIVIENGVQAAAIVTVDGGNGNDFLAGPATLNGGAGDDTLQGQQGFANTYNGGTGIDTLLVKGTAAADLITVSQTSSTGLSVQVGSTTDVETIAGLELVAIDGGNGADTIGVRVADNLSTSLGFQVVGGSGADRLVVRDEGLGDLIIHRQSATAGVGSITVGSLGAVEYEGTERVDIAPLNTVTGTTGTDNAGRVLVIPYDTFESNDDRNNAIPLGGQPIFIGNLVIDPGPQLVGGAFEDLAGDEDWFEFRAEKVGTYRFATLFREIEELTNGRPGLPQNGDIDIGVYNAAGTLIASSTGTVDNESVDISVAPGNVYYVRVYGFAGAVNVYDLKVSEVDLSGPRITGVAISSEPSYDLFSPTPALEGPTPGIKSLTISLQDNPNRAPGDLYAALAAIANNKGHYVLRGDHTGVVAIASVAVTNATPTEGGAPTATIVLGFADYLPDDRYTLTVLDTITDPAGNALDGESNASTPTTVTFNSGDGVAGGSFVARFTVDSRAELAVFSQGGVVADLNSNFRFDGLGAALDAANRDVVFQIGTISDQVFAGRFEPALLAGNDNDGFDKLGAYGYDNVAREYRFLLDLNHDGLFDVRIRSQYQINAIPVAGDFAPSRPGDEIGLFDGTKWYIDTNGDNQLDTVITTTMRGLPIVGDFNGDRRDDFGVYDSATNLFQFDLNRDGSPEDSFKIDQLNPAGNDNGFGIDNGFNERPFTGDWNLDGIDDLGLSVPSREGSPAGGQGEWFVLVSDRAGALPRNIFNGYSPSPLGNDLYATFGAAGTLPLFGNFDPPVGEVATQNTVVDVTPYLLNNSSNRHDVNGDGSVTPLDALTVINKLNSGGSLTIPSAGHQTVYLDVSGDGYLTPLDALLVINRLNSPSQGEAPPVTAPPASASPSSDAVDPRLIDYILATAETDDEEDWADSLLAP